MYVQYNPNPKGHARSSDCVIRALTKALDSTWCDVYIDVATWGLKLGDMPSSNAVWGDYLLVKGFTRYSIPNTCPECYTIKQFCEDHPQGLFVVGTGNHVVTVIDGDYYDSWDSGDEIPLYVFTR